MKLNFTIKCFLLFCLTSFVFFSHQVNATQLSGSYTIDSTQVASSTNFKNLNSAITYLTSAGIRSDGGPSNTAPFGVNGNVMFDFTGSITTHIEYVDVPVIPGVNDTTRVYIYGHGHTIQFNCSAANYFLLRLTGASYINIDSLNLKTTNNQYGWGIQLRSNSNYNNFTNCTIDLTSVSTVSTANAVGIAFSNSTTSPTTSGANGSFNLFYNNTILGHPTTGGPYYAISICPQTSSATVSSNKFINNTIQNFYYSGFYLTNTNGTLLRGNSISNPTRTSTTTIYPISVWNGSRSDTIINNRIFTPFGAAGTSFSTVYGIAIYTPNTPTTNPCLVANNLMYDLRGNGGIYGIYSSSANNWRYYHNTIVVDHANSTTTASYQTYGFYHAGTPSGLGVDFRNNIIYLKRGGSSSMYNMFIANAGTLFNINNNVYFKQGVGSMLGSFNGLNYSTFQAWRTANSGIFDSNSVYTDPLFVSQGAFDFTPSDGFVNNKGANVLSSVPLDINFQVRSATPDPGVLEFTPPTSTDAGIAEVVIPSAPLSPGTIPVNVKVRNAGTTTITSATINWTVNGVAQTPFSWTGSLAGGNQSGNVNIGSFTLTSLSGFNITAWTSNPNNGPDARNTNDTAYADNIFAVVPGGTYTINQNAAASPTNFISFTSFANTISYGGVGSPIIANVVAGSGPYTEQVIFSNISGTSATNTITINGNNQMVQFNAGASIISTINLIGSDYMTFDNLRVRSLNASYGGGFTLTSGSDYNKISNCFIDISSVTGSSLSVGIGISGSLSSPTTTGINGSFNTIENNTITGGAAGGPYYGVVVMPTTTLAGANNRTIVRNNIIRDFTVYGFYIAYSAGGTYRNNILSRPTKSSPTTHYGFYMVNSLAQDTFDGNVIKQPFQQLQTSTGTFYGFYAIATNIPAARPVIFSNNLMFDIKFNGTLYGFYQLSASNLKLLHNTFIVDHAASTSTGVTQLYYNSGTPTTTTIRNNIFFLNRGGTANKHILYFATTGAGYVCNNNVLYKGNAGSNTFTGYYTTNQLNLADWKLVNTSAYDQNSMDANPQFRTYLGAEFFQPGSDSLNNIGFNANLDVPRDVTGALRSNTPDPGAYEFSVQAVDAGVTRFTSPLNPISLGVSNVDVTLKNFGTSSLTSAEINWTVNGAAQTLNYWTGSVAGGDTASVSLGTFNFVNPGFYNLKAWSTMPNMQVDSFAANDTVNITLCTPISGTVTLNPTLPSGSGNFTTFASLMNTLQTCGVAGPVQVNVAPGVYNEQVTINGIIPGSNSINNIVISGLDSSTTRITHDGSLSRATVLLNGAKCFTFRNITIENTGASAAYAVLLTNGADSNSFIKSTLRVPLLSTGLSAFACLASSGSNINLNTAGNTASYLKVDSCSLVGGYYGADLYSATGTRGFDNIISNSVFRNQYYYPFYAYYQNRIVFTKNVISNAGNFVNTFSASAYLLGCDGGFIFTKNQIFGQLGGYGIYLTANIGTSQNRNLVANNMIQAGAGTNTTYGIFDPGNAYTDYLHNSVNNTTGDASYASTAFYYSYSNSLYNNIRIRNNVFASPAGALAFWCANTTILGTLSAEQNNNVYYSTSSYPWRLVNNIFNNLTGFRSTLNLVLLNNPDTNSIVENPNFFSTTNLRSINPALDSIGAPFASVPDDIDGNTRSTLGPDAGVNEFAKALDDAGVIAILVPSKPILPGLTDVRVVIKNFGISNLTSAIVSYRVDTMVRTKTFTGLILPGATDTVLFDTSSGMGNTSQQLNFTGALTNLKAYTSSPNTNTDLQALNDTAYASFCGAMSGTYTINPTGTGATNFVNIQDAVDKLNCGGVAGPVVFNIATGTYTGQYELAAIAGTSATNTITFQSASGLASSVTIQFANANAINNHVIKLTGASYMNFRNLTIRNTNTTSGRVISINKLASLNINTNNIEIRNCILEGVNTTSTADALAVIYGPSGDNAFNINIKINQIRYGSYGVYLGGQNIINQFSSGLVIDSNTVFQPYWAGIYLLNRNNSKIRRNLIDGNPSYGYYGIFLSSVSNETEVLNNIINNVAGYYGLYIAQNNYYGELGTARVHNNAINMMSTNTQYGIYLANISRINFLSNTVRCQAPTTTYAVYFSGNTTSTTTPQIVQTNNVKFLNNIFYSQTSYAFYLANNFAQFGISEINNNLYYSTGTNFSYVNGVNHIPANFYSTYRGLAVSAGISSDSRSIFGPLTFVNASTAKPLESATTIWNVNGRASQQFEITNDVTGANRSNQVINGTPDIGAYEVLPTSTPLTAFITDSIYPGSSQRIIENGDTIAVLTWGLGGTVPSSITAHYYPGTLISDPTNTGSNPGADYFDAFWRITASGGSNYSYDLTIKYDPIIMGKVLYKSDVKMAKKQTGVAGTWVHFGGFGTAVDTIQNTFTSTYLTSFSDFTGTTDYAPLPIELSKFDALRSNDDANLIWTTVSEINSEKFEIERGEAGKDFVKVGEVKAANNSKTKLNYSFTDEHVKQQIDGTTAYYRIKMIDRDGSFEFSPVLAVNFDDNQLQWSASVYPNPFSNELNLKVSSLVEMSAELNIVDLSGIAIMNMNINLKNGDNLIKLDQLSTLEKGIYILKLNSGDESIAIKLMKD
ncbi:MAG: T9SS type A sorting domain-containing protein [Bacteroidia bacterium]